MTTSIERTIEAALELLLASPSTDDGGSRALSARCSALASEVVQAYRSPDRHYHGLAHLADVLAKADILLARLSHTLLDRARIVVALAYHDAVMVFGATDNEDRSASLMRRRIEEEAPQSQFHLVDGIEAVIQATRDHRLPAGHAVWQSIVLDADLAILGADDRHYDRYVMQVRREYAAATDEQWRTGRSAFLMTTLQRGMLYQTTAAIDLWQARAQSNLARELQGLSS